MKKIEQTLTSMEVAEMTGKEHKNLIRDIRGYVAELNELNFEPVDSRLKVQPSDFFRESSYKDGKGETRPCYKITKKGCEFAAHKMTGIKGTEFTARYINRFHDMEDAITKGIPQKQERPDREKIALMNAQTRMAQTYLKLAGVDTLSPTYKSTLVAKAAEVLSGEKLLPLLKSERAVYSAGEIGERFGISANKVGRLSTQYNLKVDEYGEYRRSKSEHSPKEVDTWVYFDTVIPAIEQILNQEII